MRLFAPPTSEEWLFIVVVFFLVGMMVAAAELIRRLLNGGSEVTRKFVHIIAGVLMMCSPFVFNSGIPVLTITGIMIVATFLSIKLDFLKSLHGIDRSSYGTTYHPLSFFLLVLLFWDVSPVILTISISILAIPDALAAMVGQRVKDPHFIDLDLERKTVEGTMTMFVSSFLCIFGLFEYFHIQTAVPVFIVVLVISMFVTGWELISFKGSDNLTVPMSAAFLLYYFMFPTTVHPSEQMILATVLGVLIGLFSYYFNFLSLSGSVATFLLATIVFGIGGWMWTIPILTFFIASSLLSKYGKAKKKKLELIFDKSSKRDSGQVAANGGLAGLIVILWYSFPERDEFYVLYLASIAAVTADTWGTEIGTLLKGKPRSIITFRPVDVGTSGGVSLAGFIGGAVGAGLIIVSAAVFEPSFISLTISAKLILSGVIGSAVDSLLGATIQAQYQTVDGDVTERTTVHGVPTTLVRGFRWMNNDLVNLCCGLSGALVAYILL
ncbi:MAG: DUF92 domain-containing protein [Bacteroidota bacterium]